MKGFYALVDVKDGDDKKTYVVGECVSRLDAKQKAEQFIDMYDFDEAKISMIRPYNV